MPPSFFVFLLYFILFPQLQKTSDKWNREREIEGMYGSARRSPTGTTLSVFTYSLAEVVLRPLFLVLKYFSLIISQNITKRSMVHPQDTNS